MNPQPASIEIHLHMTDGRIHRYLQDNAGDIRQFFENFQPNRLFSQPNILFAGSHSAAGYNCSMITRIDIVASDIVEWPFPHGISSLDEITEEEFHQCLPQEDDPTRLRDRPWKSGELVRAIAEFNLAGGGKLFVKGRTELKTKIEQRQIMQHFLPGHFNCRRREGGAIFLNPANVESWTIYPGPPEIPQNVFLAHFIGIRI